MLCRFYVILFVPFYIKKYNSVPVYFIASKFDKIIINNDLEESKKIASNLVNEFIENE